jgi:hypothetical protein
MCLTDEHLEGGMQIAATEIKPYIEKLIKQNDSQIHILLMADFIKEN